MEADLREMWEASRAIRSYLGQAESQPTDVGILEHLRGLGYIQ